MTSDAYVPKKYVSLENQGYVAAPPPYRKPPRYHHHRGSSGCGCLRWCCCCFFSCCRCCICTILIIILIIVASFVALYYFFKPHMPSYNIENIDVKSFDLRKDNKVFSDVAVVVKAENPNGGVGLNYLQNEVRIIYAGSQLCSGQIPPFLQPGKNITKVNVALKGVSEFGPEMQQHLMQDQKEGNIPLLITVRLPVRLVLEDLIHLKKFVVNVNCSLVIDQLQPNKKPTILKKDFTYGINF